MALTADVGDGSPQDSDGDTVTDDVDNCPVTPNTDQADGDADGTGDVCEKGATGEGGPQQGGEEPDPADTAPSGSSGAIPLGALLLLMLAGFRRRQSRR